MLALKSQCLLPERFRFLYFLPNKWLEKRDLCVNAQETLENWTKLFRITLCAIEKVECYGATDRWLSCCVTSINCR